MLENEKKFLDQKGLEYLWSKINMQDYPNNDTLIAVINAIDESKADKTTTEALQQAIDILKGTDKGSIQDTVINAIATIVANAPEDFDTLKEIADWIANDETGTIDLIKRVEELEEEIENKTEIPETNASYQMLVTDSEGNTKWEERTHYAEQVEGVVLEETALTITDNGIAYLTTPFTNSVSNGLTYIVTYNGTPYECIGSYAEYSGVATVGLGNLSFFGGETTNDPFALLVVPAEMVEGFGVSAGILPLDGSTTFTITITGISEIIHRIDEKYIPMVNSYLRNGSAFASLRTIGAKSEDAEYQIGKYAFAEGVETIASGNYSHAEGSNTIASGITSHAEGYSTIASGDYSHAEGQYAIASGHYSHAEGHYTIASGINSHAEGVNTIAPNDSSHAEGWDTIASGRNSHAENEDTIAVGTGSHAEGKGESISCSLTGEANALTYVCSIKCAAFINKKIKVKNNIAKIISVDDVNNVITVSKTLSETAITNNTAYIYATGAEGSYSHVEGSGTTALGNNQHVQGQYNIEDSTSAHIVGNGTRESHSNAHTLDWNGNAWYAGDVYVSSTSGTNKDEGSKKLATEEYVNTEIAALVNSAPEALDTIGELATAFQENQDIVETLNQAIGDKADKTAIPTSLPNPNALTFTGAVSGTYDGSTATTINIPTIAGTNGVSATHSWNGTVLTVTSASGTSSADLKGAKGDKPIKGTDYFTEADKEELVMAVIAALPDASEVSY